jgi:glycerol 2-dehydrogenase (NADP+)
MPLPKGLKLSRTGDIFERIGLGTWKARPNGEVGTAVKTALTAGYKNIDGAWIYGNEAEIGAVLKEEVGKTITRKDLFYAR